jgi:AcrR family transcriptional regulator
MPSTAVLPESTGRRAVKGRQTRSSILDAALALAAHEGLEGLSIGALAEAAGMSKSGVFAHFGSREELQIAVIRAYHARFEAEVFQPALSAPRGLPRLQALLDHWIAQITRELDSGCLYISGAVEFDDRPGAVRDALVSMVQTWRDALRRAVEQARDSEHLRADTDIDQLLFELHGLILALHHDTRFLHRPEAIVQARRGLSALLKRHVTPLSSAAEPPFNALSDRA